MKSGERDLIFLCDTLCLLSSSFGFTIDNEFECKQLQVSQCCNSVCLCFCMGLDVTHLSHHLALSLLLSPFPAHN